MSTDSPCIDMCGMDRRSGWCRGCGRTAPEIRAWRKMQPGTRKMVLKDIKRRLQRLMDQGRAQEVTSNAHPGTSHLGARGFSPRAASQSAASPDAASCAPIETRGT
ncbi:DUF1289 domain-containing protein [Sphingomonas yabuuchiae]|uniref:DUF1289 domain-containing protein n=1 Tax=Sphingomonas yabuuchiae TaxID=172044 RepID=UPI0035EE34EF